MDILPFQSSRHSGPIKKHNFGLESLLTDPTEEGLERRRNGAMLLWSCFQNLQTFRSNMETALHPLSSNLVSERRLSGAEPNSGCLTWCVAIQCTESSGGYPSCRRPRLLFAYAHYSKTNERTSVVWWNVSSRSLARSHIGTTWQ